MSLRLTAIAAALVGLNAPLASAATTIGMPDESYLNATSDRMVINGHESSYWYYWSFAIWATDGGTFSLDTATLAHPWPWGTTPVEGDYDYDYYLEHNGGVQVVGYTKGVAEPTFNQTFTLRWDATQTLALNLTQLDLVTFTGLAASDGEYVQAVSFAGTGITAAVPEPGTYAMLLAGLGLLGLMARRTLN